MVTGSILRQDGRILDYLTVFNGLNQLSTLIGKQFDFIVGLLRMIVGQESLFVIPLFLRTAVCILPDCQPGDTIIIAMGFFPGTVRVDIFC